MSVLILSVATLLYIEPVYRIYPSFITKITEIFLSFALNLLILVFLTVCLEIYLKIVLSEYSPQSNPLNVYSSATVDLTVSLP